VSSAGVVQTVPLMGTIVTIQVLGSNQDPLAREAALERALVWFEQVEATCSRFDRASELCRLSQAVGVFTPTSELLFRAVEFACALAAETEGAFDPTVGHRLAALGFDRHYQTGERVDRAALEGSEPSYLDVELDTDRRAIRLARPLQLDLGAVAKGLAIDLAARELAPLGDFAIDAGGDLYLGGRNEAGEPWRVGVRHPRAPGGLIANLRVSDQAVCTSGDYERRTPDEAANHLIDPRSGATAVGAISATVVAPTAMVADGLSTAAFVLGPRAGLELLTRGGVDGLIVGADLSQVATPGVADALLSHS
jgi:thiamine biosynthesis lipoprotein